MTKDQAAGTSGHKGQDGTTRHGALRPRRSACPVPEEEVVAVKNIQNAITLIAFFGLVFIREQAVRQTDIGMHPVVSAIVANGIKKTTV